MAMTGRLRAYLALEHEMMDLERSGDAAADALRDAMDPLWYALDDEERRWLDNRIIGPSPASSLASSADLIDLPPTPAIAQPGLAS